MSATDRHGLRACREAVVRGLLARRADAGHWDGRLSSSALSTATAVLALEIAVRNGCRDAGRLPPFVTAGARWLTQHQNPDGGWGDTVRSRSNISTTAIVWATLSTIASSDGRAAPASAIEGAEEWLRRAAGDTTPDRLRSAILHRYGKDKTFSVPILTVLALTGKLGEQEAGWRSIPQLPFELAALPHAWFQYLQLPVVSYALPALIAIGQVRHRFAPSRNPATRLLRDRLRRRTHRVLREIQSESGGYLEAAPLTSFVVMSLAAMREIESPVVESGIAFLTSTVRDDGSWPIDTNLSTWVTTLSIGALADADALPSADVPAMARWLLDQQGMREHPFTHAAPGAWAWTPLSGGVPDADDTSGALLALSCLADCTPGALDAASRGDAALGGDPALRGVRWLMGVQNRDGGIPTFCRGWGALPFDRSTPEITAHALQAWSAWHGRLDPALQVDVRAAAARAVRFLLASQRGDGTWIPLWFGNEHVPSEDNPVYGTARVLLGLATALARDDPRVTTARHAAVAWLLDAQNADGGWGGAGAIRSSIEETGIALAGLARSLDGADPDSRVRNSIDRGGQWLRDALNGGAGQSAAPIGLYFARLWYYEDLYPLVFGLSGLTAAEHAARQPRRL